MADTEQQIMKPNRNPSQHPGPRKSYSNHWRPGIAKPELIKELSISKELAQAIRSGNFTINKDYGLTGLYYTKKSYKPLKGRERPLTKVARTSSPSKEKEMQDFEAFQSTGVKKFTADQIAQAVADINTAEDVQRLAAETRERFDKAWGYDPNAEIEDEYAGPIKRRISSPS